MTDADSEVWAPEFLAEYFRKNHFTRYMDMEPVTPMTDLAAPAKKEITAFALRGVLLRACGIMNGPTRQCVEPCVRCAAAGDALFTLVDPPRFINIPGIGVIDRCPRDDT